MKKTIITILLALFVSVAMITNVSAAGKPLAGKKLMVSIKSPPVQLTGMGLALATSALMKGADVTVVLGAKPHKIASKKGGDALFKPMNMTLQQMLKKFIAAGGRVYICKMCLKGSGLTQKDMIKGAKVITSGKIWEKLYEPGMKNMDF